MTIKTISRKNGLRMALGGFCSLLFTMDASVWMRSPEHGHGPAWMALPGFFLFLGFAGTVVLAIVAKWILFPLLKRDEDTYEEKTP